MPLINSAHRQSAHSPRASPTDDAGARSAPDINAIVARNVERFRQQRRMSATQVARLAGVSKATLLSIELGAANPTLETLQRIGAALNLTLNELITESTDPGIDVRRAEDASWRSLDGLQMRPLATFYGPDMVYVFTATVNAAGSIASAHEVGAMEALLVLSGAVRAGPTDALVELQQGDWIRFPADREHACHAIGEQAEVLFVAARRSIPGVESRQRMGMRDSQRCTGHD